VAFPKQFARVRASALEATWRFGPPGGPGTTSGQDPAGPPLGLQFRGSVQWQRACPRNMTPPGGAPLTGSGTILLLLAGRLSGPHCQRAPRWHAATLATAVAVASMRRMSRAGAADLGTGRPPGEGVRRPAPRRLRAGPCAQSAPAGPAASDAGPGHWQHRDRRRRAGPGDSGSFFLARPPPRLWAQMRLPDARSPLPIVTNLKRAAAQSAVPTAL
jgi:hypothetical protein